MLSSSARKETIARRTQTLSREREQPAPSPPPPPPQESELSGAAQLALQKKSVRWLCLTNTFWSTAVYDAHRTVSKEEFSNFYRVMQWRLHGDINEDEFSSLNREWMNYKSKFIATRTELLGLMGVRQLMIDEERSESDLDLLIGITLNETNRVILNSPISYKYGHASSTLEVCTQRWLALSEELFFLLDSPGYGSLGFDEVFFLVSAIIVGSSRGKTDTEVRMSLDLKNIALMTLQLMRESGVSFHLSWKPEQGGSNRGIGGGVSGSIGGNSNNSSSANSSAMTQKKWLISLTMFKHLLIRRSIGEIALSNIFSHVQWFLKNLTGICELYQSEVLSTCTPLENVGELGSPRLWQHSVCKVAGVQLQDYGKELPPIVLFLLSDAERYLTASIRIFNGENVAPTRFSTVNPGNTKFTSSSHYSYGDEVHETAAKMCKAFRIWCGLSGQEQLRSSSEPVRVSTVEKDKEKTSTVDLNTSRNPVDQLVLAAILEYKTMQIKLAAAVYDVGVDICENVHREISTSVGLACSLLLPKTERLVSELVGVTFESSSIVPPSQSLLSNAVSEEKIEIKIDEATNIPSGEKPSIETTRRHTHSEAQNVKRSSGSPLNSSKWPVYQSAEKLSPKFTDSNNVSSSPKPQRPVSMTQRRASVKMSDEIKNRKKRYSMPDVRSIPESFRVNSESLKGPQSNPTKESVVQELANPQSIFTSTAASTPVTASIPSPTSPWSPPQAEEVKKEDISSKNRGGLRMQDLGGRVHEPSGRSSPSVLSNSRTAKTDLSADTIADLLNQGETVGAYAQSLREMLRMMSKDDTDIKLDSLEKILELGESIYQNKPLESSASIMNFKDAVRALPNPRSPGKIIDRTGSSRKNSHGLPEQKYAFAHPTERSSGFKVPIKSTYDPAASVKYRSRSVGRKNTKNGTQHVNADSATKSDAIVATRKSVPGTTPVSASGKRQNLVFGHPV